MAEEIKDTGKAVEAEAAAKPVRRTRKKAETAAKEPAVKAEAAKTETAKAETAKKAPAKKVEPKTSVVIEFAGKQIVAKDVVAAATKAYKKANKGAVIKKIEVYVKPEENAAYYVVNGEGSADYKVEL